MDALYELKEMLCEELEEYGRKDKLDVGGLEIVDKLAHTIKNLDKIIENYEEDGEYSGAYDDMGGSYARRGSRIYSRENRGGSRRDYSRAAGRRSGVRRDSMGRYSGDAKAMIPELRELMESTGDERMRSEMQRFITRIESM
ncbi:MAG: hypothetical protein J6U56_05335 [Spirochaetia bacterium]|nr:hypothetical protein [Spirochaetia bacterium]